MRMTQAPEDVKPRLSLLPVTIVATATRKIWLDAGL
jgi:hypothetical protein